MIENEPSRTGVIDTFFGDAKRNWGWLLALGVVSVILGTVGLGMAFSLTVVGVLLFGILLALTGLFQLIDAFKCKGWKGTTLHVLIGLLYLVAGSVAIIDPINAAVALTLVLGVAFIAVGVLRLIMAFQHRGSRGWIWALVGGVVSLVLGTVVLLEWPVSGLWVIGLFIAIELIVNGWTYIFISIAARRAGNAEAHREDLQGSQTAGPMA
ncbi:MAG: HdeD family acid-resistance protein [Gammaproteobacteria bacterium]